MSGRAALRDVVCVVGPTASGKSEVAEEVALNIAGEVVSVDSMQVYRGMDIGTAKVPAQQRRCPIHMLDVADVDEAYSVARFQHDARACIDGLHARGVNAVLCGGTGLYLDAVIDEMHFPHGEFAGATRSPYENMAQEQGAVALHKLLEERDPASAAQIHPNNVRRVVRALEMLDEGTSYAEHHEGLKAHTEHYKAHMWALDVPRPMLYERINNRVDAMFQNGLVEEVVRLREQGMQRDSTAGMAIGYKEVVAALEGQTSLAEARDLVKRNTRRYAKRQLSWLRRDGRATWIDLSTTTLMGAAQVICDEWRSSTR